jgi:hypothetical protein
MSAVSAGAEVARTEESHFTPEHVADAAYRKARGHSWELIAADLKHPNPDRLRRTMEKDATFLDALKSAKRELRDEAEAEAFLSLRVQLLSDDQAVVHAAAKLILEHTTKAAERELKAQLEAARNTARLEVEEKRAAAKAKGPDLGGIPTEIVEAILQPEARVVLWDQEEDFWGRAPNNLETPMRVVPVKADGKEYFYVVPRSHLQAPPGGWKFYAQT